MTNKYCSKNYNAGIVLKEHVMGEVQELIEAYSFTNFIEELSDVIYLSLCRIYDIHKIELPMIFCGVTIRKIQKRVVVWEDIFSQHGLVFNNKYLINGSNYHKAAKVEKALELARLDNIPRE